MELLIAITRVDYIISSSLPVKIITQELQGFRGATYHNFTTR